MVEIFLSDERMTATLAAKLATELAGGDAILLSGDLGAGKSTLARALIRAALGDAEAEVPSPTFTLVQRYDGPTGPLWHYDLYRLRVGDPDSVIELGWDESRAGIVLVEWPDRLGPLRPPDHLGIALSYAGDGRLARLTGAGARGAVLEAALR
jgi:tRNA threonylcarbamoyladenosine biosynthesis protein TsaE